MARAQTEGYTKWLAAKAELDAIEESMSGWDRAKCVEQTLKAWGRKEKDDAFELLVDEWIGEFPKPKVTPTRNRLKWLGEHWGKKFVRKDGKTGEVTEALRSKSVRSVLEDLLLFALSGADSVGASTAVEFGVLETNPENERVISALTALAEGTTEEVVITRRDYNNFQKVLRLLREQGQEFKLPNGGTIRDTLGDVLPTGFEALMTGEELKEHENRKASAAKAVITRAMKKAGA
jgi:hypothetical protein